MESKIQSMYPNMMPLYEAVVEYVKEHQGDKGYLDTQDDTKDSMYVYECLEKNFGCGMPFNEGRICGLRVHNGELQYVAIFNDNEYFDEASFDMYTENTRRYENNERMEAFEESFMWNYISQNEYVLFNETLLSIVESIEEYE